MLNRESFTDPPSEFREIPFWSWNDELTPTELTRQIQLIKQAGWGGFFMHSRVGLKTPYMGMDWLQAIRTCVEEGRKLGLDAWLYDEDKWPSGFAGGLSVTANPGFRAQTLVCKVDDRPALLSERLATFSARLQDGLLVDIQSIEIPVIHDRFDRMIQFYVQTMPLSDPWFNGYAYLNLLNPEAVQEFLASTHEVYAQEIGDEFGKVVPGVFTDEPCTHFRVSRSANPDSSVPWESRLPEVFLQRHGYDLIPHLPALFFDMEGAYQVRYDYWRTVTEMFLEAFSRPYAEWCHRHNLKLTGHYMSEDTMLTQIQWGLAAAMPHYAWMDFPGVDKLGRQIGRMYGTTLTIKQLDSAGSQAGKKRLLVENFALSGQDFAHQGRKWLADWAAVLGANVHNLHLCLYSMRGERKRDCPPNLFFQQPWWPENRMIADYTARLSYALSQGKRVVDILVIHPMGSAWALYKPGGTAQVEDLDMRLDRLLNLLLQNQRDFHLGDEMMMEPGGSTPARVIEVNSSKENGQARLQVGEMSYKIVILPACLTLVQNTVRILEEFQQAGGKVFAVEPTPYLVEGQPVQGSLLPTGCKVMNMEDVIPSLDKTIIPSIRIPNQPDIWVHQRQMTERKSTSVGDVRKDSYFLANTSLEKGGTVRIELTGEGEVEEWDLVDGSIQPLPGKIEAGFTTISLDFSPAGSHLILFERNHLSNRAEMDSHPLHIVQTVARGKELRYGKELRLGGDWEITHQEMNSLVLDCPEVSLGSQCGRVLPLESEETWQPAQDILSIQTMLFTKGIGTTFSLRYSFEVLEPLEGNFYLVMEAPQEFVILVNEQSCVVDPLTGWWLDPAFSKVEVSKFIHPGRNTILLKGRVGLETELEAIYLLGQFTVDRKRKGQAGRRTGQWFDLYEGRANLKKAANVLVPKEHGSLSVDLTEQGFSNFAGRVTIKKIVTLPMMHAPQEAWLRFENLRAAVAHIHVNHQEVGSLAWQPHRLEVSRALKAGENLIEIELVNTLRNLLGPLHSAGGEGDYTGPGEYRDARRWTDDHVLTPFGFDRVVLEFFE